MRHKNLLCKCRLTLGACEDACPTGEVAPSPVVEHVAATLSDAHVAPASMDEHALSARANTQAAQCIDNVVGAPVFPVFAGSTGASGEKDGRDPFKRSSGRQLRKFEKCRQAGTRWWPGSPWKRWVIGLAVRSVRALSFCAVSFVPVK